MKRILLSLTLAACAGLAQAHGDVECPNLPQAEWKPQIELQRKLVAEGWRVRQVKTWSTCYEVYGFDDKGQRAEAFFNPVTFDRIEEKKKQP